jgi:hypothetical protein
MLFSDEGAKDRGQRGEAAEPTPEELEAMLAQRQALQAIKARADALASNANLIALTQAEKWNGQLPTTIVPNGGSRY